MKSRTAIVTGANGFVGSHLCRLLSGHDTQVIAVVRNKQADLSRITDIKGIEVVHCEMSDYHILPSIIDTKNIDVMYHFAWEGSSGPLRGDADVQIGNIRYSCELIRACKKMGIKRFVFASSIMAYEVIATMNRPLAAGANTLYSTAKLTADYMCRAIANELGITYIRGVISNIYGPGETSPRLINTSIRKMLSGEHCAYSEGNQLYDFIYVDDAVKAFKAIGNAGENNKTYYIGSLTPRPLREYLLEMRDCVDPKTEIGLGEIPFDGISLRYDEFDIEAVKKDTGFVPKVSFREGIRRTADWIRESM